ncbi:hypothetical protein GGI04_004100 [Coemansia thaxteri]|uniref:Uncharacterized protein n=1 Tax=Coemansia thaxteri TaxID=2663907 RepID=A0A9W8BII7_9FUNG|nr:hypothetical protein GGI04_004100 [Coemansia thaxteri]KAJ2003296.1 hypothetical protein H4R26_003147 [Coemansia thaxteri]KAJ2468235.1 hypothetical protein GGI02_003766 [Coemansia sp. RSA 2322]KAJ2484031.1 hypothetical protein EV174_002765 [Coemansia sp. RSA 2320]
MPNSPDLPIAIISATGPSVISTSLVPPSSKLLRTTVMDKDNLLLAEVSSNKDVTAVRQLLAANAEARCLVEFHSGNNICIMTLREDGFVWNQESFIRRHSGLYDGVARRNPFLRRMHNSPRYTSDSSQAASDDHDDDNDNDAGELMQIETVSVHEIRHEDCPRLYY